MAAKYQSMNTVSVPVQQLRDMLVNPSFFAFNNYSFKSEVRTYDGMILYFGHGVTFSSWGENIQITLSGSPNNPGATNVSILSECSMPTQIIDWGKNKENVDKIFTYIYQNADRYSSAPQNNVSTAPAYCMNCGKALAPDANFCIACGFKIK